jgi:zinc protease
LDRAKASYETRLVFESDNQVTLARRYGEGVALGRSIDQIDALPGRIQAVSLDDIKRVATEFLTPVRAVTGILAGKRTGATAAAAPSALPAKP